MTEAAKQKLERFSMPEPNSGCWLWLGHTCREGYGRVRFEKETRLAHRVSWIVHRGPLPPGAVLLHKCDNPACINPDHLRPGTQADNIADMVAKGRQNTAPRPDQRGTRNGNSRFSADLIRAVFLSPLSQKRAAKEFGMSQAWVWRIRKAEVWPEITKPLMRTGEKPAGGAP